MDDLALIANLLYRRSHFHNLYLSFLLVAIRDPSSFQVVRRKLYQDLVAGQDAYEILPHLARDVRQNLMFGMNRGTVGFLMNEWRRDALDERLVRAKSFKVNPLRMTVDTIDGEQFSIPAINEVSLLRETRQTAKLTVQVNGRTMLPELVCDGVLVATPAGSTAYNLSAQGPIIPIDAPLLALTPISPFRPRRWRGALLPDRAAVTVEVLDNGKRPVAAVADHAEVRDVSRVDIRMDHGISMHMLFDPGHSLDERILREQFGY